jgi:hypothetical protein
MIPFRRWLRKSSAAVTDSNPRKLRTGDGPPPVIDRGEPVAELSPARQALMKLAAQGALEWGGGKPKGLRGVFVRGEPVSETILRDRR